jgi:SAM-dependent methyltransferase
MTDRERAGQQALEFSERLWQHGDPWELESSEYEKTRYARLIALLKGRRYGRALELGCGAGQFTRLLTQVADRIVGFDIAPTAIARARAADPPPSADFRVGNAMDYAWRDDGPWDLVVMNETICYLGWLYSFFDVGWFAAELFAATREGGCFLMANSMDPVHDKLLLPHIIRTYRDLFLNTGFALHKEEIIGGVKSGVTYEVLASLFVKPEPPPGRIPSG